VRFEVNADGILSVSAKEQSTGTSQAITVKPTHGLTEEEIEQMLIDSIEHAEEDMQARQLRDQQIEAERILHDARKQLAEFPDLVSPEERAALEAAMAQVAELRQSAIEAEPLAEAIHALDEASRPFVERVMNRALSSVLEGRRVDEV
jgi:molecular chaperone HscA